MKYIVRRSINGKKYWYFEATLQDPATKKDHTYSRLIGEFLPENTQELKELLFEHYGGLSEFTYNKHKGYFEGYFGPSLSEIEANRMWFKCLRSYNLFEREMKSFMQLFSILFVLNSSRAEGSRMTRDDSERMVLSKTKPKSPTEKEARNSIDAMSLAFSKEKMRWNQLTIKKIHRELLKDIDITAGKYKAVPNIAGIADARVSKTTAPKDVSKEMKKLLDWFNRYKGKYYPPLLALEFHWRFERIHPFSDGNGRIGRILLNAHLLEYGFMPVIFFSENHQAYCNAIAKAIDGYSKKLGMLFGEQYKKTRKAFETFEQEGELTGKSCSIGEWSIIKERGPKLYVKVPEGQKK